MRLLIISKTNENDYKRSVVQDVALVSCNPSIPKLYLKKLPVDMVTPLVTAAKIPRWFFFLISAFQAV